MTPAEIRQIKDQVPIRDAAMRLGIELDTSGKKARCFNAAGGNHKSGDRTPSLSFFRHDGTEFFKCWGCGIKGDLFKLVQEILHTSFIEAARWLVDTYHLRIPSFSNGHGHESNGAKQPGPKDDKAGGSAQPGEVREVAETQPIRPQIEALPEEPPSHPDQDVYRELLRLCPPGKALAQALRVRGIDPGVIDRYPLGWINNASYVHEALVKQFGLERLRACGICHTGISGKEVSFLYGMKFLFPFVHQQDIVFLQARSDIGPGEKPPKGKLKFKNPKNLSAPYPYNADAAYRYPSLYICEAVFELLTLASLGVDNIIALKGTQTFLPEYAHWLKEAGVTEPVLAFNADEPGYAAVDSVAKIFFLNGFQRVLSLLLPHTLDVNDFYGRGIRPDWMQPDTARPPVLAPVKPPTDPANPANGGDGAGSTDLSSDMAEHQDGRDNPAWAQDRTRPGPASGRTSETRAPHNKGNGHDPGPHGNTGGPTGSHPPDNPAGSGEEQGT